MFGFGKTNDKESVVSENQEEFKINLVKRQETFKISLEKTAPGLKNQKFAVEINMDRSGSMSTLYSNGTVQGVFERIMPIALKFDDNGSIGVHAFHDKLFELPDVNTANCVGYVKKHIEKISTGMTKYAPFVNKMVKKYKDKATINEPVFCIFVTDGNNDDKKEMIDAMKEASKYPIFFKFVGVGREKFEFLQKLDDLSGRFADNADFQKVDNISAISDEALYDMLLVEIEDWLKEYRKAKGL